MRYACAFQFLLMYMYKLITVINLSKRLKGNTYSKRHDYVLYYIICNIFLKSSVFNASVIPYSDCIFSFFLIIIIIKVFRLQRKAL